MRWGGAFAVDRPGRWTWQVTAWSDHLASWLVELGRKVDAAQHDLSGELSEGALLLGSLAERAKGDDRRAVRRLADRSRDVGGAPSEDATKLVLATHPGRTALSAGSLRLPGLGGGVVR